MKKYFILTIALLFVAGIAYAEGETFTTSGQYRMEMYDLKALGNSDEDANHQTFIDQRFRAQFNWMPADGVKAVLRGDFAETTWGGMDAAEFDPLVDNTEGSGGIGYRPNQGAGTVMIDKAYVDLTKEIINFRVGLYGHGGFGNAIVNDNQGANIWVTGDFAPVTVDVLYTKLDEGNALTDDAETDDSDKDTDLYGAQVSFGADAFKAGAFYVTMVDDAAEDTKNAIGLFGSSTLGKISFWGEIDLFSGADDANDIDYVGTNVTLNGEMAIMEKLTAGLDLFWAAGSTDDGEEQIAWITDDWGYTPFDHGPFHWIQSTGIDNHEIEDNAGSTGLNVYGTFGVVEDLTLYGNVGYILPSEEDPDDDNIYVENYTVFSVGATYFLLPKTSFNLKYENVSVSGSNIEDDAQTKIMGMLKVSF